MLGTLSEAKGMSINMKTIKVRFVDLPANCEETTYGKISQENRGKNYYQEILEKGIFWMRRVIRTMYLLLFR